MRGGLQVGDGRAGGVDQLAHLFLHLRGLRGNLRGGSPACRRRRRRRRAVGAERHDEDLTDHVFGLARPGQQRVLDDRHHAVRARGDEARLHRVEQVLVDLDAIESRLVEGGRHVARGVVLEPQVRAHAEQKDVAQDGPVGVVADDLGDLGHLAPAIGHARLVDDEVDGGGDLRAHRLERDIDRRHHHHRLQARQRVAGGVGVDGRHRPVVAGVHRLQHVQGLGAADLAHQDAVGPHAEAVAQQLPDRELALALDVRRAVLEGDDVRVVDLQLGRVLDGDHALVVRDEARDHVERRRLAGAGAAGDEDVHAPEHRGLEKLRHGRAEAALVLQVLDAEDRVLELADRQRRAVDRGRPDDGVDAASVRQAGVDHRVEAVDVAAGRRHHAPDGLQQLVLVLEADLGFGQYASPLDEDLVGSVDHDLAHGAVVEQAVERAVADRRAQDDVGQRRLLLRVEDDVVLEQELVEVGAHRAREGDRVAGREAGVADQRQAVAEVVGELVEVAALARGRFQDVRAAPARRAGRRRRARGRDRPGVDELGVQQRGRDRDRRDDSLDLGQADLDRDAFAVRLQGGLDVGRDPLAVAEPHDRLAGGARVTWVGLQVGVVDGPEDDVFDVARRDVALARRVVRGVEREALARDRPGVGLAVLQASVQAVDDDFHPARAGVVRLTRGEHGRDFAHGGEPPGDASTGFTAFFLLKDVSGIS